MIFIILYINLILKLIKKGLHAISNIITENDFTRSYCLELGIIDIIKASLDKK